MGHERNRLLIPPGAILAILCLLLGCDRGDPPDREPTYGRGPATQPSEARYAFGVFPLRNAAHLVDLYQPLVDELNRPLEIAGRPLMQLELSRDHADFESKLQAGKFSVAIVNPGMAVRFEKSGYRIFGKASNDDRYRGILLVRKNANLNDISDLRGRHISFPSPTSFEATLMNKMFLHERGLDVDREASVSYTGSNDSAILNVFEGISDVAGTWPAGWETIQRDRPELGAALEIRWQTDPLVQLALVASDRFPTEDLAIVREALFHLSDSERGRKILRAIDVPSYQPATSAAYEPVRQFMTHYAQVFGTAPE